MNERMAGHSWSRSLSAADKGSNLKPQQTKTFRDNIHTDWAITAWLVQHDPEHDWPALLATRFGLFSWQPIITCCSGHRESCVPLSGRFVDWFRFDLLWLFIDVGVCEDDNCCHKARWRSQQHYRSIKLTKPFFGNSISDISFLLPGKPWSWIVEDENGFCFERSSPTRAPSTWPYS